MLFLFAIAITIIASAIESFAFMYSFEAIKQGVAVRLLVTSLGLYIVGILVDYFALYVMSKSGTFAPELLAMIFMTSVIIGIALISGNFFTWKLVDQIVAVAVVVGIAWLSFRTE